MFKVGDRVYIEDSAQEDCTLEAWQYIEQHRKGTVRAILESKTATGKNVQVGIEFPAPFSGGHYLTHSIKERSGQYITDKHVSLCFEESREVQTIPNI